MNKKKKEEQVVDKKSLIILLLLLFLLVISVIGVTYQIYYYKQTGSSIIEKIIGPEEDDPSKENGGSSSKDENNSEKDKDSSNNKGLGGFINSIIQGIIGNKDNDQSGNKKPTEPSSSDKDSSDPSDKDEEENDPNNPFRNGSITLVYTEGPNGIKIDNALPVADEEGRKMTSSSHLMNFTVSASMKDEAKASYEIAAIKDQKSTLANNYIKLYLERSTDGTNYTPVKEPSTYKELQKKDEYGVPKGNMVLDQVEINEEITYYYRLRMWLDSSYNLDSTARYFSLKVNIYGKAE